MIVKWSFEKGQAHQKKKRERERIKKETHNILKLKGRMITD
jgi:hypothetical protein